MCETDDGRTLIHCFAGCEPGAILAALGLTLADLFPDRGGHHRPAGRPRIPAPAVLSAIVTECWIIATVASDVSNGFDVDAATAQRVALAAQRVQQAARLGGVQC